MSLRKNRSLQIMFALLVLVWIVTAIHPLHPSDWLLEKDTLLAFLGSIVSMIACWVWVTFKEKNRNNRPIG